MNPWPKGEVGGMKEWLMNEEQSPPIWFCVSTDLHMKARVSQVE